MSLSVAVAGKGGVGKTTISALLVRALCGTAVRPVLAVDADPNSNLAAALGVEPGRPLADIREQGSLPEGSPPSGIGRLRAIDDQLQRAIVEADGFDLITMGRPEGPRCYCAVNHLLRHALDKLARSYPAVVVDNEAGMEHLSRRTTTDFDFLATVVTPTLPAIRAAQRIEALAAELPIRIGHRLVLVNRAGQGQLDPRVQEALAGLSSQPLPAVPEDPALEHLGAIGGSVFELPDSSPSMQSVLRVVAILQELKAGSSIVPQQTAGA